MSLRYRIGMRAVKTVVAVGICLTVFQLLDLGRDINGIQASLAAVICMKSSLQNTLRTGVDRTIGTVIGSLIGVLFLLLSGTLPAFMLSVLGIIGTLLIIYLCNVLKLQASVPISIVVFLIILIADRDIPPVYYGLARLAETVFGIFVAYMTNRYLDLRRYRKRSDTPQDKPLYGIRSARQADIGAIMQIWLRANIAAHPFLDELHWHEKYDDMRSAFSRAAQTITYMEDGRICGFLSISAEAEIIGIYVAPEAQRKGLGSSLMGYAKDTNACLKIRVYKQNDPAVKFLFNRGFSLMEETETEYVMHWCDKKNGESCKVACDNKA